MSLKIKSFEFNAFQENTFIVSDPENNAVIIDPGCYSRDEEQQLITYINQAQLKVVALLNTHAHIDHVLGNSFIKETLPRSSTALSPRISSHFMYFPQEM